MKGILKKGLAVLKRGVMILPALIMVGGITTAITTAVVGENKVNDFYDDFAKNEIVVELKEEDYSFYENQKQEGNISNADLVERKKYLESREYLDGLLELPEFSEQKGILKSTKHSYDLATWIAVGAFGLSTIGILSWVVSIPLTDENSFDAVVDFWDSAADDWNWAAENPKPKKGQKKIKDDSVEIEY